MRGRQLGLTLTAFAVLSAATTAHAPTARASMAPPRAGSAAPRELTQEASAFEFVRPQGPAEPAFERGWHAPPAAATASAVPEPPRTLLVLAATALAALRLMRRRALQ